MKQLCFAFLLLFAVKAHAEQIDYTSYVNPFIGTTRDGTTFPGAVTPFGMLPWSPDTGDRIGGYLYEDPKIRGFSVYRVSGTGGVHGQDLPFMPTILPLDRSPVGDKFAYASRFSHEREHAAPGQYQVHLEETGIDVDLAVRDRSGLCAFQFPQGSDAAMILYPTGRIGEVYEANFSIDPTRRRISGYSFGSGAGNGYSIYVVAEFDQAFRGFGFWRGKDREANRLSAKGKDIATYLQFDATRVQMRIGISYVSLANAEENLRAEIPHWDLARVKKESTAAWNDVLGRIAVKGGTLDQRMIFYTALYHASLHPNIFSDVNGQYMDMDDKVQQIAPGHKKYANYSLWDVYRTIPQLQALLQPKVASDMVQSLLLDSQQCQGGGLPIFSILNSAPGIMCGYPADPFIASAYAFGARDFDLKNVQKKMVETALNQMPCGPNGGAWWHMDDYKSGYVAHESSEWGSVSYNIEYAVADFSVAMMSAAVGDREHADYFFKRSQNWKNLFNPERGFMQERYRNGTWVPHFTATDPEGFMEGNAMQQSLMVPHNIAGVLRMTDENHPVEAQLDQFFSQILISGWPIDQPYYWAGNEPVIGMPWYYNWLQKPWKTQDVVRKIRQTAYSNAPGGLPGNDDLGTMSAWYVFAALGLYPEIPGVGGFSLHTPLFRESVLTLGDGRRLVIRAEGGDLERSYIGSVNVNAEDHESTWLPLDKLLKGSDNALTFQLAEASDWGMNQQPPSFDDKAAAKPLGAGEPAVAFDHKLRTSSSVSQILWIYQQPTAANAYTVTAGREGSKGLGWSLFGSIDGKSWTQVDRQTNQSIASLETRSYDFPGCTSYRHYRLDFDQTADIAEWALHERQKTRTLFMQAGETVNLPRTGRYALRLRYKAESGDATIPLQINGEDAGSYYLPRAYHPREADAGVHMMQAGLNTVKWDPSAGIEGVVWIAEDPADPLYFEAEWGQKQGVQLAVNHSGSWGQGVISGFRNSGDALRIPLCVSEAGLYQLSLRYASPYGDKWNSVYLDEKKIERLNFPESSAFSVLEIPLQLSDGAHTLMIRMDTDDWGWIDLDALWFTRQR